MAKRRREGEQYRKIGTKGGYGKCMKYIMFTVNFLIFIGGLIILGIGLWALSDKSHFNKLLGTNLYAVAVCVLIGTGATVTLLSLFGCVCVARGITCMPRTYFTVMILMFVIMFVIGIVGYVYREKIRASVEQEMTSSLTSNEQSGYHDALPKLLTDFWDSIQQKLQCCGVSGPEDWNGNIPQSCCKDPLVSCQSSDAYEKGCVDVSVELVQYYAKIVGAAVIVVACLLETIGGAWAPVAPPLCTPIKECVF